MANASPVGSSVDTEHRSHYRITFIVLAVAIGAFALLQSLVIPVLPTIQGDLHTSQNTVTWVLTAYLLSASIFTPIMGRLGDMYGKKRLFVIATVALVIGSLISALTNSIDILIVSRVIQGIGGGVLPLSFGIIRDEFPKDKVTAAVGMIASLTAVGAGAGIILAGPIVDALDYHWLFWIPAMVLALCLVATIIVIPESIVRIPERLNWAGVVLLSAWLVALLLPISEASVWGWGSPRVIILLLAAAAIAISWVVVESRSAHPLIDMKMMRIRAVWTANLVALLFGVGMYAIFAFLPEFLQTHPSAGYGFGLSITRSGLIMVPLTAFMFVLSAASGHLTVRYGGKLVLVVGAWIGTLAFALLVVAHSDQWVIVVATSVMGTGFGLSYAAISNLIVAAVPPTQTGVASGMNANIRTIGGSIGAAVMSSVVTASAHNGAVPRESGYTHGFELLTAAALAAAVAAMIVPSARRHLSDAEFDAALPHPELGLVAAGTLIGDESE